jgi:glutamine synthetase
MEEKMIDTKQVLQPLPALKPVMFDKAPARFVSPKEVIEYARAQKLQIVDLKFVDLLGTWQHFSIPITELEETLFTDGIGFDGSSIRGFQAIHESDMLLVLDPTSATTDPVCSVPTMTVACNVLDPITREPYTRDPRHIALKAERYLEKTGIATISYWGPEAEFFIFDNIRFDQDTHSGYYFIDSDEGVWNSGRDQGTQNLGHRPRYKEGYFPVPPADMLQDIRSEIILRLIQANVPVEVHHHEVATAGQCEIDMRYAPLVTMADSMMMYKYIVKNVARRHGKTVTFMPKPIFGDNGSGMHTHQSIWKEGKPLFAGKEYAGVSQLCLHYIGGILKHAPALAAFTNPSTNSYKRLTPGFEAPVLLAYSSRNRSAGIRIPMYSPSPKAKRIEVRFPDPACNPYLSFAAMLMAGLDGIENKINPGEPAEKDLYDLEPKEAAKIRTMPGSLDEALNNLEKDHQFLLKGGVFSEDLIDTWIGYKRSKEVDTMRLRPHPYEFFLYYDV